MRRRNPYVVLGLPYGASRDEANIAFARRAKAVPRGSPDRRERLAELTWALHEIEESIKNPAAALGVYRIPADPDGFLRGVTGLLAPPPEPVPAPPVEDDVDPSTAQALLRELVLLRARLRLPEEP